MSEQNTELTAKVAELEGIVTARLAQDKSTADALAAEVATLQAKLDANAGASLTAEETTALMDRLSALEVTVRGDAPAETPVTDPTAPTADPASGETPIPLNPPAE